MKQPAYNLTLTECTTSPLLTDDAKQWCRENMAYLNRPMDLFGSSTKVEKGADKRETYVMYLQPAGKVAARTLCIGAAAAGCEGPCLISSGMLGMTQQQSAATKRTVLWLLRPDLFEARILAEIDRAERRALKTGVPALFRLNGTSDIDFGHIVEQRPLSGFYDYTKLLSRVRSNTLANYHLTFSGSMYSAQSRAALAKAAARGYHIAVAYNSRELPSGVVSFDKTDLRPLDEQQGTIGWLSRKGSNKAQRAAEGVHSFFVTDSNIQQFQNIIARG